ncbi:hypothetical protein RDWZM_009288 [Blomia tropicalis]|uniref:RanBD1 domain-containing protein n=1 Tax=Blomia tropicalis TaxID=40697 RepID=A0A9Q0M2Q0_BLOTA|nr:Ran-binding protein 3 [Blomia tropicalis]KAJ6218131.1 hypothetical protein RDWZM_009288 [Blomia tropicalis]
MSTQDVTTTSQSDSDCLPSKHIELKQPNRNETTTTTINVENVENAIARSESVIKSPSKPLFVSASTTPVIKVVDSSSVEDDNEVQNDCANQPSKSRFINTSVIATASNSFLYQNTNVSSNTSFLSTSAIATNPFLRISSFGSSFGSSDDSSVDEANNSDSFSFAPSKLSKPALSARSGLFDSSNANLKRPSVVIPTTTEPKVDESENTSSTKTQFISLNKEENIFKTPTNFFTNAIEGSFSFSNGSSASLTNDKDDQVGSSESANDDQSSKPLFTFGQNLSERVVIDQPTSSTIVDLKFELNNPTPSSSTAPATTTTTEKLISFSDVTKSFESNDESGKSNDEIKFSDDPTTTSTFDNEEDSLKNGDLASDSTLFKRKYEVITGEEDEHNVLSIHGKLYAWDAEKTLWLEKGRGYLRLNDVMKDEKLCSRLVMRTTGALRVILNAHIVAGMKFELANDNCLRFTYVDGIYLIKANPKDIDQLNSAIECRLREIAKRVKTTSDQASSSSDEPETGTQSSSANDKYLDDI